MFSRFNPMSVQGTYDIQSTERQAFSTVLKYVTRTLRSSIAPEGQQNLSLKIDSNNFLFKDIYCSKP